jgi:hypothetical protein
LLNSPLVKVSELEGGIRTLETPGMDMELARKEFLESPIYRKLLMSLRMMLLWRLLRLLVRLKKALKLLTPLNRSLLKKLRLMLSQKRWLSKRLLKRNLLVSTIVCGKAWPKPAVHWSGEWMTYLAAMAVLMRNSSKRWKSY